jgi:predicted transcriptional regulator
MEIGRRRSSIEVIADILRIGEASKTEIMYGANMSFFQLQKYMKYLLELALIDKVTIGNPTVTYRVTAKGSKLLQNIDGALQMLEFQNNVNINFKI